MVSRRVVIFFIAAAFAMVVGVLGVIYAVIGDGPSGCQANLKYEVAPAGVGKCIRKFSTIDINCRALEKEMSNWLNEITIQHAEYKSDVCECEMFDWFWLGMVGRTKLPTCEPMNVNVTMVCMANGQMPTHTTSYFETNGDPTKC